MGRAFNRSRKPSMMESDSLAAASHQEAIANFIEPRKGDHGEKPFRLF
jgi:hypothetical protein